MHVGDRVRVKIHGHWADGQEGVILRMNVFGDDAQFGHKVQLPTYQAIIHPDYLEPLDAPAHA